MVNYCIRTFVTPPPPPSKGVSCVRWSEISTISTCTRGPSLQLLQVYAIRPPIPPGSTGDKKRDQIENPLPRPPSLPVRVTASSPLPFVVPRLFFQAHFERRLRCSPRWRPPSAATCGPRAPAIARSVASVAHNDTIPTTVGESYPLQKSKLWHFTSDAHA